MYLRTHNPIKHKHNKKPNIHKLFAEDLGFIYGHPAVSIPDQLDTSSFTSESDKRTIPSRPSVYTTPTRKQRLRHNPGSVYHHATRLSPYLSSSTNFSSSLSGSIEVIVSELEHQEEPSKQVYSARLSPLGQFSECNSPGDSDTSENEKVIWDIIKERKRSILGFKFPEYHPEPDSQIHLDKSLCDLALGMQEILTEKRVQAVHQERQRTKLKKQLLKFIQTTEELSQLDSRAISQDSITSEESFLELKEPIHIAESIIKKPLNSSYTLVSIRKTVLTHALSSLLESDVPLYQEVLQTIQKTHLDHLVMLLTSPYGKLQFSGLYKLNASSESLSAVFNIECYPQLIELSMISKVYHYDKTCSQFIELGLKELNIDVDGVCLLPYSKRNN